MKYNNDKGFPKFIILPIIYLFMDELRILFALMRVGDNTNKGDDRRGCCHQRHKILNLCGVVYNFYSSSNYSNPESANKSAMFILVILIPIWCQNKRVPRGRNNIARVVSPW